MSTNHVVPRDAGRTRCCWRQSRCRAGRDAGAAAAAVAAARPRRRRGSSASGEHAGREPATSRRADPSRASRRPASPINIGTIDTHQPGTDFTDGPNMIKAYFSCVNANGGVNGHPLKLFVELDQTQPAQITAAATAADPVRPRGRDRRRLRPARVHARRSPTGSRSGIYEMDAGIAPECWSTPNSAAVNMGPRYSSDGAVQYALDHGQRQEDRVRAVQRPGHRLHRRRPGRARQGGTTSRSPS